MMRFSIITPSFNDSEWLRLCVASVADQQVEHEHLVQDAGSNDGTLDWLLQDHRVRPVVEKDAGMYDAVNRGFRRSHGDILAYLNCDEQYLPGSLEAVDRFFRDHPEVEVLFADAIAVDSHGSYLWHRKMLPPRLWHTWTCPLSILTCATFFRRSVIEQHGIVFDSRWRFVGDSAWVLRLIQTGCRTAVLRQFTSVFTHTGQNLSLDAEAQCEAKAFHAAAPGWMRMLKPLTLLHHRARRLFGGIYSQQPFEFSLYTRISPEKRVRRGADKPTFRWRW